MNLDYLNYKKRSHVLISINSKSLREPNIIQILSSYVGGLIVNVKDIKEYKEQELVCLTKLTYTPIFIQKSRFLYRLDKKLAKTLKNNDVTFFEKLLNEKEAIAAIVYSPLTLQLFRHERLKLPVFLSVSDPLIFDKYFKSKEFTKECNGFVLHFDDVKNDSLIINQLKKYF